MQTRNKKQILTTGLTILISVSLVAAVAMAVTTVGNDVSVGNDLGVANNAIISGDLDVTGAFYATGTATIIGELEVSATTTLSTTTIADLTVSGASSLSTIDSGTWEGTEIGVTHGGTGLTSITQGNTLFADTNNSLAATSTLFVHSNSYVGIATTTPTTLLHVYDSNATSTIYINSGGAGLGGRVILEDNDGAGCTEITCIDGNCGFATVTCP